MDYTSCILVVQVYGGLRISHDGMSVIMGKGVCHINKSGSAERHLPVSRILSVTSKHEALGMGTIQFTLNLSVSLS